VAQCGITAEATNHSQYFYPKIKWDAAEVKLIVRPWGFLVEWFSDRTDNTSRKWQFYDLSNMHGVVSYVKRFCILWVVFHAVHVGMILYGLNSAKKKSTDFVILKHFVHSNFLVYPRTKDHGLTEEASNGNRSGGESREAARLRKRGESHRCQKVAKLGEIWGGYPPVKPWDFRWSEFPMGFSSRVSRLPWLISSGMTVSFATWRFFWVIRW